MSPSTSLPILTVGAGIAGVTTALEAAEAGQDVILVERDASIGGRVLRSHHYFPKLCPPSCGMEINVGRLQRSPRICGRGSGAASLVAYCMGITNVCPVKHNLYFERFLNPGRKDPPDIDVDFAWDERDGILESVLDQYRGHAAMVCNHVAFRPRMAIREVAKVYGLTDREIGQVSKRHDFL